MSTDYTKAGLIAAASNVIVGTNPAYTINDFLALFPQFEEAFVSGKLSNAVLSAFVNLASASLVKDRWGDLWAYGMGLYIAHLSSLHLQASAGSSVKQIVSNATSKGVLVSKSVGDVSASYQAITSGWEKWGSWNLTTYGQQLMSYASIVGIGMMYVY